MNDAGNVINLEVDSGHSDGFVGQLDYELHEFTGCKKTSSVMINSIETFIDDNSIATTIDEKWASVLDVILKHVIREPYLYLDFGVSTFAHFLHDKSFQPAVTRRLEREIAECMLLNLNDEGDDNGQDDRLNYEELDDRSKIRNFSQLVARLLTTNWPSQHKGFARQRNALTYVAITAVHTWLDHIEKATKETKSENREDAEALKVCCYCLIQVVKNTGRKLWLTWPDLVDRIYSVIKLVMISNISLIPERLKERLLSTYVQINDFPKSTKSVKMRDAYSQTYQNMTKRGGGSSMFDFTDFSKMLPETSYHRNRPSSDREDSYFRSSGSNYYRRYENQASSQLSRR